MHIKVRTSDTKIWNLRDTCADISYAMSCHQPITIDLCSEGPDLHSLEIYDFLLSESQRYQYDISMITVLTNNLVETDQRIRIEKKVPWHAIKSTLHYDELIDKRPVLKHFGLFIGRSTPPRIVISSQMYKKHRDKMIHTNHLDLGNEFYMANLSFDDIVHEFGVENLLDVVHYVLHCPINANSMQIDKDNKQNAALQMLAQDRNEFLDKYQDFFVEIVCDTYYTGDIFFPSEKLWRPILLQTPFIFQGAKGTLKHLHNLGFKTFAPWWNEGYNENEGAWAVKEVLNLIDELAKLDAVQIRKMYDSMRDVLAHNRSRFLELDNHDFLPYLHG